MAFEVFHFEVRTRMRKAPDDFLMDSIRETFNLRLSVWDSNFTVLKLKTYVEDSSSGDSLSASPKSRLLRISSRLKRWSLQIISQWKVLFRSSETDTLKESNKIEWIHQEHHRSDCIERTARGPYGDSWKRLLKNLKQFHWNFQIESLSVKEAVSIAYKDL